MKLNFKYAIMAVAALTMGLTSCNNDNEGVIDAANGEKAKLNIEIAEPVMSKATGAPEADVIANYTVFVTNQSDEIGWTYYNASGANLTGDNALEVSNKAKHVYIVANAGDLSGTIKTVAQLNGTYLADLNAAGAGSQLTTRWATGSTSTALSFTESSGVYSANAAVTLKFIAARITLTIQNGMTGYNAANTDGDLVLNSVAVLNARGQSKLFGTSLIPSAYTDGKKYYEGFVNNNFPLYPTNSSVASSMLSNTIAAGDFTTTYHYYVFENDATTAAQSPTIITLVGTFNGKTIYYPVHLASYETFKTGTTTGANFITRGHSYNITINMTVDPKNPGGTIDPFEPITNGKVNITLDLTDWTPITLGKEF